MKLFVIVLCLLSERFLVHQLGLDRFAWFDQYVRFFEAIRLPVPSKQLPWIRLGLLVLLPTLLTWLLISLLHSILFGLFAFFLSIIVVYYCLGPTNPFYPVRDFSEQATEKDSIMLYLSDINEQLFAVIFWYILLGPAAAVCYRLIALSRQKSALSVIGGKAFDIANWLPVRFTTLLYLLVGNFQKGFREFSRLFFSAPQKNEILLRTCGLQALGVEYHEIYLAQAEQQVLHALVLLLVFFALFTIMAWV